MQHFIFGAMKYAIHLSVVYLKIWRTYESLSECVIAAKMLHGCTVYSLLSCHATSLHAVQRAVRQTRPPTSQRYLPSGGRTPERRLQPGGQASSSSAVRRSRFSDRWPGLRRRGRPPVRSRSSVEERGQPCDQRLAEVGKRRCDPAALAADAAALDSKGERHQQFGGSGHADATAETGG